MVHGVRAPCVATPLNVVGQAKRSAVGVGRHGDWWNLARIVALNVASLQVQSIQGLEDGFVDRDELGIFN
jgi:hypothetical protein